jgi:hypothetical protein
MGRYPAPTIVLRAKSRLALPASDVLDVSSLEARLRTARMGELYGATPADGLYRTKQRRPARERGTE